MKRLILAAALIASPALAQDHSDHTDHNAAPAADPAADAHGAHATETSEPTDPHAGHNMPQTGVPAAALPQSGPPPEAFSGPDHAADTIFTADRMAPSREELRSNQGCQSHSFLGTDRLEAQIADGEDGYLWETNYWHGGDIDKLWVKTEGEGEFGGAIEEAEIQALWSHAIGPYFDLQTGIRYDIRPRPDRAHAVIGVQGLAPYFFEIDAAAFVSSNGDVTARVEVEVDQRITQQIILQPRIELNLSAQDIPEHGIGQGFTNIETGLRLRYEITPQFAPYIGVEWQRDFGDTADFTRAAGSDPDRFVALIGARFWF